MNHCSLLDGIAHCRQLANTTERSVRNDDAALRQITLTTYLKRQIEYCMKYVDGLWTAYSRHNTYRVNLA